VVIVCPRCRKSTIDLADPTCRNCRWRGDWVHGIPRLLVDPSDTKDSSSAYRGHYESLAASDLETPVLGVDYLGYQAQNLVRYIGRAGGLAVCDVGCGRGTLSTLLAGRGARVTAVDLSVNYLRQLGQSAGDIRMICCDADNLPFEEEFDLVVSTDVMEHTLRPGGFLYSVNSALKPGGRAYILVPYRENLLSYAPQLGCGHQLVHLRSYNKPLLRDIFGSAGFKVERFYLDGFSLGTPWPWLQRQNSMLAIRYNKFAERARARRRSEAAVTMWPSWLARLMMRPLEIVVRARKLKSIEPAPGGTMYRLVANAVTG